MSKHSEKMPEMYGVSHRKRRFEVRRPRKCTVSGFVQLESHCLGWLRRYSLRLET